MPTQPALIFAIARNNQAKFGTLVHRRQGLEERDHLGRTPLLVALECSRVSMALKLLREGVNPNRPGPGVRAPIESAILGGQATLPAVSALITCGADINGRDHHAGVGDVAPLALAIDCGNREATEALLNAGAKLECAVDGGSLEIIDRARELWGEDTAFIARLEGAMLDESRESAVARRSKDRRRPADLEEAPGL